jgi:threonine dehydrogenase-like Zn-dependent dehydrogenase
MGRELLDGGGPMRAAVRRGDKLVVDTIPDPVPGPGDVLVKTLACGICGSDLHALRHMDALVRDSREMGGPFSIDPGRDIVMGHEFCAEVIEYGPDSQRTLKPGTRVCSMPTHVGPGGVQAIGYSNDYPGGYAETMVLSEMLLLEVPNGLPTEHAALTEPMAVGIHAVEKANLTPEDLPLVIGCGPVGLAVIVGLKLKGVGPLLAADFSTRPGRRRRRRTATTRAIRSPPCWDPGSAPASSSSASAFPASSTRSSGAPPETRASSWPGCAWRTTGSAPASGSASS